ncbi:hypothetical protein WM24_31040 [Burkholderia ubonensis]|nr:hypothetical protein WM24_31040 [Burkholderia ubonensis]
MLNVPHCLHARLLLVVAAAALALPVAAQARPPVRCIRQPIVMSAPGKPFAIYSRDGDLLYRDVSDENGVVNFAGRALPDGAGIIFDPDGNQIYPERICREGS